MAQNDTANLLAQATDAIRNESRWLKEQAERVTTTMDLVVPTMSAAWKRIRDLEQALSDLVAVYDAEAQGVAQQATKPERVAHARNLLNPQQ